MTSLALVLTLAVAADPDNPFTRDSPKKAPAAKTPDAIRKQLAELKRQVRELEAELAKLEKPPKPASTPLNVGSLAEGASVGPFGSDDALAPVYVASVRSENEFVARVPLTPSFNLHVLVTDYPTKGLVDDALVSEGKAIWQVTGTRKVGAKTMYTVKPYKAPK